MRSTTNTSAHILLVSVFTFMLAACGSTTSGTKGPDPQDIPPPEPDWWDVPLADVTQDANRPGITLTGDRIMILGVGETYVEPGATASDAQDGDLSADISIDDQQLDTSNIGDYVIRYNVTDSDQREAIEVLRFVRVVGESTSPYSGRSLGTTISHFGYIEHLPANVGVDPDATYPLLIYNHGNSANAGFSGNDPNTALSNVIGNAGPPLIIHAERWGESLPFIVLMPQFGFIEGMDPAEQMNNFVEFAFHTYPIDRDRVYMTGWSQGGFLSLDFTLNYPDKVAAVASLSSGLADEAEIPDHICDIEEVPMWLFHGNADDIVDVSYSLNVAEVIESNCQPPILPRLTIFDGVDHSIQHPVFDLSAMTGGNLGFTVESPYTPYDQTIYDWLLNFRVSDR